MQIDFKALFIQKALFLIYLLTISFILKVDFLNSIIVDMKQKNEELTRKLEAQATCWEEESDVNL